MKTVGKHIDKDMAGTVTVIPDEQDDLWHVYNLVVPGDTVSATTFRKVQTESATGSVESQRLRIRITLTVESLDIDSAANQLAIKGRNQAENKYVKLGAYHTILLEMNRPIKIFKDEWDSIALERIKEASQVERHASVAAVVLQEGLANVCLLTDTRTVLRQRVDVQIPKKRKGFNDKFDKAMRRFYEQIYRAVLLQIDFSVVKVVIVGSPGFLNQEVMDFMKSEATRTENKIFMQNVDKFLLTHTSAGHVHSLSEAITSDSTLKAKLGNWKAMEEARALERFQKLMASSPDRAAYGWKQVAVALDMGAVETLMIADSLFRSENVKERRKYVKLTETVKRMRGQVLVFSTMHDTGLQLQMMTGLAAILAFAVPEIDDVFDEDGGNVQDGEERRSR